VHSVEPESDAIFPFEQPVHDEEAEEEEYFPASHEVQVLAAVPLYFPAAHTTHFS
jgi:hypothetical protein